MRITYYGHSCIGVNTAGHDLLIAPFISGDPLAKHIDLDSVDDAIENAKTAFPKAGIVLLLPAIGESITL